MNKTERQKKGVGYWLLYLALPVIIVILWEAADLIGLLHPYTMPSVKAIVKVTIEYLKDGALLVNLRASIIRVLEGFFAALAAAFVLGMGAALSKRFEIFIDFVIQILRPIPPIAWIPLAILWFGIGEMSKVFIIFLGAFFPMFINLVDGVKSIDPKYYELARVYEVPRKDLVRKIILPGALPSIMTGIRLGLGNAWVCVVAAEMIGAITGVGYMLSNGRSLSRPDIVVLGMLIVGIVGKLMDDVLRRLREHLIKWI